jgi:hypothetical protein
VTKKYHRDYSVFVADHVALELRTRGLPDPFNLLFLVIWPANSLGIGRSWFKRKGKFKPNLGR